jgi:hypothetical protein
VRSRVPFTSEEKREIVERVSKAVIAVEAELLRSATYTVLTRRRAASRRPAAGR